MPAPQKEITAAPASPQQAVPVTHTAGRGGIPLPVLQAGHGRGAAVPPQPRIPTQQRISGAAPILQAAQAAGPVTLPVTEVLPEGILPYTYGGQAVNGRVDPGSLQTGYKFLDPNTGREAGFPTLKAAQSALNLAGTPAGVEQAQAGLLERIRQVGGQYTSAEGFPQTEQEQRTQTTVAEDRLLEPGSASALVAPALAASQGPAASTSRPAQNALGDRGFAPNEKIEIIRGLDSQIYNTNPQGLSAGEVYREHLNDSVLSNLSGGRPALDPSYHIDRSGQPHRLQTRYETLREVEEGDRAAAAPSLDKVKGSRAQALINDPAGITDADRLLFSKGSSTNKLQTIEDAVLDPDGYPTGAKRFFSFDPQTGQTAPLNLNLEAQGSGAAAQKARSDAARAVKLGKLTRAQVNERLRKAGYPEI